jgi:hypothetical protein
MSEWFARVYRQRKGFRVVVEGLLDFDTDRLEDIEARTAEAILVQIRKSYPPRTNPWWDPAAELILAFDVAVHPSSEQVR